ncbi:MAG: Efflux ABC transporter, ATP-binding protein, partial [uncultured Gemmatimonadetes bacterium]
APDLRTRPHAHLSRRRDGASRAFAGAGTRHHRVRGRQRGRQEHLHQDPAGAADAHVGRRQRLWPGRPHPRPRDPAAGGLHARARLPSPRHDGHGVRRPHGAHLRPAPGGRPRARRRNAAPRGPVRRTLPPHRRIQHRDEAARKAGAVAGARSAAAAAGRAHQRAGPRRPRGDAGAHPPHRPRVRHRGDGVLAPAGGDRARQRLPGRHRRGPAEERRRAAHVHRRPAAAGRGGGRGDGPADRPADERRHRRARGRRHGAAPPGRRPPVRRSPRRRGRPGAGAGSHGAAPQHAPGPVPRFPQPRQHRGGACRSRL